MVVILMYVTGKACGPLVHVFARTIVSFTIKLGTKYPCVKEIQDTKIPRQWTYKNLQIKNSLIRLTPKKLGFKQIEIFHQCCN